MDHGRKAGVGLVAAHGHSLELLQLAEEVLDQVPPFVDIEVNVEGRFALRPLRDDDLGPAFVQLRDDPVGVERLSAIRPPNSTPLISGATPIVS